MGDIARKLATVQFVKEVAPIPGADAIERITVKGWELVAKKGEFKQGDACVFFEIDSVLPDHPVFEFMRQRKFRVKTAKMRGQVSQGLAMPVQMMRESFKGVMEWANFEDGQDLTAEIGVKKWEPGGFTEPVEDKRPWWRKFIGQLIHGRKRSEDGFLDFPTHLVQKTDEERVQNIPNVGAKHEGELCYVTEKVDGQSATYLLIEKRKFFGLAKEMKYAVYSRNRMTFRTEDGGKNFRGHVNAARACSLSDTSMEEVLCRHYRETGEVVAVQGEVIGPDVQKNKYGLDHYRLYVFGVTSVTNGRTYDFAELKAFVKKYGLRMVPVLEEIALNAEQDVKYFVEKSKGKSQLADIQREGIVIRSCKSVGRTPYVSFKAINPDFLLKWDE